MKNNKFVALALSLIAVAVVLYQFVFKKSSTSPLAVPSAVSSRPQQSPPQAATKDQPRIAVDTDSTLLLQHVYDHDTPEVPKRELPGPVGFPIFSQNLQQAKPGAERAPQEIIFRLDAIVLDQKRKMAVINGTVVREGDEIAGALVREIRRRRVILEFNNQTILLTIGAPVNKIEAFGGKGED